jgi:5-methyltetrahydropteroyltriglutamate--homocysteine methyltransferase
MHVHTGLASVFPRSEALVAATRDFDRGRTTADALEEIYSRTEAEVVALEERLGFGTRTAGYLRWQDLFRPFAETWDGFTVGPVTRWFETNTFFRRPVLHTPPERRPGEFAARLPPPLLGAGAPHSKILLPGPYTFAGLLDNRSGETDAALIHRIGRLLAEEVKELRGRGYRTFQFQEPLLAAKPPEGAMAESVLAAYQSIAHQISGGTSIVWTYHGDGAPAAPLLARLSVGVVGVDLAETDVTKLPPALEHKRLGLGVVDPRTTLVEEAVEVARIVRAVRDRLHPSSVWLSHGAPIDLLPWEPATRKLHVLPAARQLLEGGEGGGR